jgi:ribonuclease III
MARRKAEAAALEQRLGYSFKDGELLLQALTHVSAAGGEAGRARNYQRLEFLGDRVLGLAVADMLFTAFPAATEGELSRRLSELVRRETCAEIAIAWDVGPHLALGAGELQSGGRRNRTILADVCESIIGAVFVDGGYEAARALVERAFADKLARSDAPVRDAKTALQEWAQGNGLPTPVYDLIEQTGPQHAPSFFVAAKVGALERATGSGPTKRAAEQDAAQNLLIRERVWTEADRG